MKNLVKELEWDTPWHDASQHAYAYEDKTMYLVYEDKRNVPYFTAKFEIEGNVAWQRTRFKTLDDAKAACQQHYAESLWDNLSPRAKVAVSIGMATLAQLNMTDKTLAEVIKEQNF